MKATAGRATPDCTETSTCGAAMRIDRIQVYALPFAFKGGAYVTSYGPRPTLENLAVVATTDTGLRGFGEIARVNLKLEAPTSDAFIADLEAILPGLLGADPCYPDQIIASLPPLSAIRSNIPAAIDGLCLDILSQSTALPAYALLGGQQQREVPLYYSISRAAPDVMREAALEALERGFRILQVKIGEGIDSDIERIAAVLSTLGDDHYLLADANGGYAPDEAERLVRQIADPRLYWEEPCTLLDDNLGLAERTGAQIILDQCLIDLTAYAKACVSGVVAGCGLKPTLQGGITKARTARDICIAHGIKLKVDDVWALEPSTLASLNLSMGVPAHLFLGAIDQWAYFDGNLSASTDQPPQPIFRHNGEPGLGMALSTATLGIPVLEMHSG